MKLINKLIWDKEWLEIWLQIYNEFETFKFMLFKF